MDPTVEQMRQQLAERNQPMSAVGRAAAGQAGAKLIKSQPEMKASEALGRLMEKGFKKTTTTQADRTRVGGGNIGGAAFSAISEADPAYAGKVWGVMDPGTASRLTNLTDPETAWTTMLGSATQLKTNPIVFGKLRRAFLAAMKEGKLSPELAAKINHNLELTFGENADIRDPKIWQQADTFEKRAALADLMMGQGIAPGKGGKALGGEKSGKGVIFKPTDILKAETEPSLMHPEHGGEAPTFAAGPRLFSLAGTHEQRPDLHPGFPTLLHGKDLGMNVKPTPTEVYLPEWHSAFKKANPTRKGPGYYDLALGVKGQGLPSQALHEAYIRHLMREGFAEGGAVEPSQDQMLAHVMLHKAAGGAVQPDDASGKSTDLGYYEGGPSDAPGMDPMQYRAAGGAIRPTNPTHIGVDEAPAMPVKLYMPPGMADGSMPVGGVDFQPEAPGQQMMPGQPQQPQQGQAPGQPGQPGQGQPPGAQMPQMGQAPAMPPTGPQSNILQMTRQGQAMSAMRATPPGMPRMATGGSTTPSVRQMRAALLYKADGGSVTGTGGIDVHIPLNAGGAGGGAGGGATSSGSSSAPSSAGVSTPSLANTLGLGNAASPMAPTRSFMGNTMTSRLAQNPGYDMTKPAQGANMPYTPAPQPSSPIAAPPVMTEEQYRGQPQQQVIGYQQRPYADYLSNPTGASPTTQPEVGYDPREMTGGIFGGPSGLGGLIGNALNTNRGTNPGMYGEALPQNYEQYAKYHDQELASRKANMTMTHDYVGPTMNREEWQATQNQPRVAAQNYARGGSVSDITLTERAL